MPYTTEHISKSDIYQILLDPDQTLITHEPPVKPKLVKLTWLSVRHMKTGLAINTRGALLERVRSTYPVVKLSSRTITTYAYQELNQAKDAHDLTNPTNLPEQLTSWKKSLSVF